MPFLIIKHCSYKKRENALDIACGLNIINKNFAFQMSVVKHFAEHMSFI